jgi:hypothetical protein
MDVPVTWALQHLAAVAALRQLGEAEHADIDRRRAARLLGFVDARLAALDVTRKYTEQQEYVALLAELSHRFEPNELANLLAYGGSWSYQQAVAEAEQI